MDHPLPNAPIEISVQAIYIQLNQETCIKIQLEVYS